MIVARCAANIYVWDGGGDFFLILMCALQLFPWDIDHFLQVMDLAWTRVHSLILSVVVAVLLLAVSCITQRAPAILLAIQQPIKWSLMLVTPHVSLTLMTTISQTGLLMHFLTIQGKTGVISV